MIYTNMLRQNAICLLVFLGFCGSAFSSATAQNEYVVLSVDSANVNSILVSENAFFGTVCMENLETTARIRIQARPGYRLLGESEFTMELGGSHTYKVQTTSGKEEAAQGNIILPKVDIRFEALTELTEETTNVYIGYAKCAYGYDSEPCRGRLRPVSIFASPTDKPAVADIQLSFPDGQLLEQTEDGFKVAKQSYPVAEIASKQFFLHGHTPSASVRDCSLKAVHSVSKSEDVLRYSVVHATFEVESDSSDVESNGNLIDNLPATVTIHLQGFNPMEQHTFDLSAAPMASSSIINKCGTDVSFFPTENPLIWRTSKIYWYGILPYLCCHFNWFRYRFELKVDNNLCGEQKEYLVVMPEREPHMVGSFDKTTFASQYKNAEEVPSVPGLYRCEIVFANLKKTASVEGISDLDQYAEESIKEEMYHVKQWLGQVPIDKGGQGDCGTAERLRRSAGALDDEPFYVTGCTKAEAIRNAVEMIADTEDEEMRVCVDLWKAELGFIELNAKEEAGYNAAWKFHCTYEESFGKNPVNMVPDDIKNKAEK